MGTSTLTARKIAFAREYLLDGDAGQAAVRAGYSPNGAAQAGCRLLKDSDVRRLINKPPLTAIERVNVADVKEVQDLAVKVKHRLTKFAFKEHDEADIRPEHSLKALDQLAKAEGMYAETNVNIGAGLRIFIDLSDNPKVVE